MWQVDRVLSNWEEAVAGAPGAVAAVEGHFAVEKQKVVIASC
jgi:hypothetical protein